jgi:UDP-3-O-[3-hydroxymyristoyl] glucosamine N-acyltransferase
MPWVSLDELLSQVEPLRHVPGTGTGAVLRPASVLPGAEGAVSFCTYPREELLTAVRTTTSAVVLVRDDDAAVDALAADDPPPGPHLLVVTDPRTAFMRVCARFFGTPREIGVHPSAVLHPEARIGADVSIGPNVYVGRASVGDRTSLAAGVVVLDRVRIGSDVLVGPNTTIGSTGFGYGRDEDGTPVPFPHYGGVVIGDRVEIGANTAIDRGTLDDTVLEDGCMIDNLVHVAHNVRVCEGAFVIACTILCGGVTVGRNAWVAPNSSVREHLTIGEGATVGLAATVVSSVEPGTLVVGSPARPVPPKA